MNNIREYTPGDEKGVLPHNTYSLSPASKDEIRRAYESGYAKMATILDPHNHPLGVVGMYLPSPGVGEFWSLSDVSILRFRKLYGKSMRWIIERVKHAYKLERAQFFVRADEIWAERWAEFLGFKKEAILRKYKNGQDHYIFAWVREDGI